MQKSKEYYNITGKKILSLPRIRNQISRRTQISDIFPEANYYTIDFTNILKEHQAKIVK